MGRLIKYFFYLSVISIIGLWGYSFYDPSAPQTTISQPVALD